MFLQSGMDYKVSIGGNPESVEFTVKAGSVEVGVDWDVTTNNGYSMDELESTNVLKLVAAVANGVQIWYNLTGKLVNKYLCY